MTADHETGVYTLNGPDLERARFQGSPDHSRTPVALYARGPGAEKIAQLCRISDVHWILTGQLP